MTSKPFFEMTLPMPPSINDYYGYANGRVYVKGDGKRYKQAVQMLCRLNATNYQGKIKGEFTFCFNDNRRNDLDNRFKAFFDALTKAKVWGDDCQVDEYTVRRGTNVKGGQVMVRLWRID